MAQVGPLRECQVVVGPASTFLSPVLVSQAVASGSLCFRYAFRNAFAVSAFFTTGGILSQSSGTRCEKKFFLTSSRGAGIRRFSGSAAGHAFSITRHFKPSVTFHSVFSTQDPVHLLHV
jgi:hypothetical protein